MQHGKHLNKSKVIICLLAYFLGWIEGANAMPLLFVVLDDSHKAIVTENQGKFHLTVHHRGNGDKHEHAQHTATTIITSETAEQSDHEIGVCGGEQLVSPATKIIKLVKEFTPLTSIQTPLVSASSHYFHPNPLFRANPFSTIHTAILLI